MTQNNGNGSRPKVDPKLGEEVRLKLLKDKPFVGQNGFGAYFLYAVLDLADATEKAFFAPDYIHEIIESKGLKNGSEFLLKKVTSQNGKKIGSKLEIALVGTGKATSQAIDSSGPKNGNGYKEIMLQCMLDAYDITKHPEFVSLPLRVEDIRSIALTLYISRSKPGL